MSATLGFLAAARADNGVPVRVERVLFRPLVAVLLLLAVPADWLLVALLGREGLDDDVAAIAAWLLGVFRPVAGTAGFLLGVDADIVRAAARLWRAQHAMLPRNKTRASIAS